MLEVSHLHVQFKGYVVLSDVTMSFNENTLYLIHAQNGSGKSTFLNAISGLIPYSGTITRNFHPKDFFYIPNNFEFDQNMSGYDYLKLYKNLWDSNTSIDDVITMLQIKNFIFNRIDSYSLGMKQMFTLALYIISDTQIWLIDELNNGLDKKNNALLIQTLKSAKNKLIIFVTHQYQDISHVSDLVLTLEDGKLVTNV